MKVKEEEKERGGEGGGGRGEEREEEEGRNRKREGRGERGGEKTCINPEWSTSSPGNCYRHKWRNKRGGGRRFLHSLLLSLCDDKVVGEDKEIKWGTLGSLLPK